MWETPADIYTVQQQHERFIQPLLLGWEFCRLMYRKHLERRNAYADTSIAAGAAAIFSNIEQLSLVEIQELLL